VRCLVLACPLALAACSNGVKRDDGSTMPPTPPPSSSAPSPKVVISTPRGDAPVTVEVVSTPPRIERGLMFREHLPPDDGMLFLMGAENDWTFWMRNTLISLDMIFITEQMTVAGVVERAVPRSEKLLKVDTPSSYVLEVNGGWAAAHHIVAGATVRFDGVKLSTDSER
jgi:uncharacterized membrane protein (UPF0127 family)